MRKIVWILLPLALISFSCVKAKRTVSSNTNYLPAPEFTLKDLKGNQISLSDLEGRVVFLNFWATWCGPCRAEIPGFVEVYEKYKEKGMAIIGISLDRLNPKSLLKFAEEYKMNYPVVFGTQKVLYEYQPGRFLPTTIIIDKKGKIRQKHIGYMDKESIENYFLKFQAEAE